MQKSVTPFAALGRGITKQAFLKNTIDGAWNATMKPMGTAAAKVGNGMWNTAAGAVNAAGTAAAAPLKAVGNSVMGGLNGSGSGLGGFVQGAVDGGLNSLKSSGAGLYQNTKRSLGGVADTVTGTQELGMRAAAAGPMGAYGAASNAFGSGAPKAAAFGAFGGGMAGQPIAPPSGIAAATGTLLSGGGPTPMGPFGAFGGPMAGQPGAQPPTTHAQMDMPSPPTKDNLSQLPTDERMHAQGKVNRLTMPAAGAPGAADMPTDARMHAQAKLNHAYQSQPQIDYRGKGHATTSGPGATPPPGSGAGGLPYKGPGAWGAPAASAAPAAPATPAPTAGQLAQFRQGTKTRFNPNSRLDMAKMQQLSAGNKNWAANGPARMAMAPAPGMRKTAFEALGFEKDAANLVGAAKAVGKGAAKGVGKGAAKAAPKAEAAAGMNAMEASVSANAKRRASALEKAKQPAPGKLSDVSESAPDAANYAKPSGIGTSAAPPMAAMNRATLDSAYLGPKLRLRDRASMALVDNPRVMTGLKYGAGAAGVGGLAYGANRMGHSSGMEEGAGKGLDAGIVQGIESARGSMGQQGQAGYFGNLWDAIKGGGGGQGGVNPGMAFENAGSRRGDILQSILQS